MMQKNKGTILVVIGGILLTAGFGAGLFHVLTPYILTPNTIPTMTGLSALLLLPLGLIVSLLFKLYEIGSTDGLTREEKRRLDAIVNTKVREFYFIIGWLLFTAVFIAICFAFFKADLVFIREVIIISGAMIGVSLSFIGFVISEHRAISRFKQGISEQKSARDLQKKALDRLTPNT